MKMCVCVCVCWGGGDGGGGVNIFNFYINYGKIILNSLSYYIPNWSTFRLKWKQTIIMDFLWIDNCEKYW